MRRTVALSVAGLLVGMTGCGAGSHRTPTPTPRPEPAAATDACAQASRKTAEMMARELAKVRRRHGVTYGAVNHGCASIDFTLPTP